MRSSSSWLTNRRSGLTTTDGSNGAPVRALGHGSKLWIGLALYIALADAQAAARKKETMSMSFWRAVCHPYHRPWVTAVWVYVTLHLYHAIPDRYDPLRMMLREVSTT
mgnify:CR=1 FL=1